MLFTVAPPRELRLLTVAQACGEYGVSLRRRVAGGSMSVNTLNTYLRDVKDFVRLAGAGTVLDSLTHNDVDDIVVVYSREPDRRFKNADHPKSVGITARFRQSVAGFFTFCERNTFLRRNPIPDTVVRPRQPEASEHRRALTLETALAAITTPNTGLVTALAHRNHLIVRFLLETGVRNSEMCNINMGDVAEREGDMWVHVRHGKGDKARSVPITAGTHVLMNNYVTFSRGEAAPGDGDALFLSVNGRRLTPRDVQNVCKKIVNTLPYGVRRDFTPHALRHTMATLALAHGSADITVIQRILGHSSLAVTGKYLDEIRGELVRAVNDNPVTGSTQ